MLPSKCLPPLIITACFRIITCSISYVHQRQMANRPRHAKFVAEAWKNQKTLSIISEIAGIDLVPVVDYEIGHINISIPGCITKNDEGILVAEDDGKAVVDWHRDSYPFVCVLMMSDTTEMVGGETALKTGIGDIMKVRGPTMVRQKNPGKTYLTTNNS